MPTPTEPMNVPGRSPVGPGRPANAPDGPGALKPYLGGAHHTAEMSAPDTQQKCVFVDGRARRAEFVVRAPPGVSGFTIHYGRWLYAKGGNGAGTELDGWLEVGTKEVTGATGGSLTSVDLETHGDAVGCYVDDFGGDTPTTPATDWFEFWYRALDG